MSGKALTPEERITQLVAANDQHAVERKRLERSVVRVTKERDQAQALLDQIQTIELDHDHVPRPWPVPKLSAKHRGVVCHMLSDMHFDERVNPFEVEGYNAYNRDIALLRLRKDFEKAVMVPRDYFAGLDFDGFQLFYGGDGISGLIHEELEQTNEDTALGTVDFWIDPMAQGIGMLADAYGKVHVTVVVGNHPRLTKQRRFKLRVRDNLDWLLMRCVAREFKNDPRVTWNFPEATSVGIDVYNTRFLLQHGDDFRGGSGIAGMLSPLMLGQHRTTRQQSRLSKAFDWMVVGHFHQYWMGRGLIVNGSLKGYDEYAYGNKFDPEPPTQALWVVTAEHGVSMSAPIFPADRKREKW